jgi:hypothetical protein
MRHSLVTNSCPACGATLLGAVHRHRLGLFQKKLSMQGFAEKLDQADLFDIALFMLLEFFPIPEPEVVATAEATEDLKEEQGEKGEEDFDDIRRQIRQEMVEASESFDEDEVDDDIDAKVERLRQIAKESNSKPSRVMVRRIGS